MKKKNLFMVAAATTVALSMFSMVNVYAKDYKIGISQFAQHPSLDNCREGFIKGLKDEGIEEGKNLKITYKNANADMGASAQIAQNFVADKLDLLCGIATPSAQGCYNAAMDTDIPVIFTAVTDPIAAGFVKDNGEANGNITGTSDKLPVKEQLEMIRKIMPKAKTIGILYTTSEKNSESSIKEYEKLAKDYDFKIEKVGITNTSDIPIATSDLLQKVDCMTNLTDNTVVNSLSTILSLANEKKIPVFGSEIEQVKKGCLGAEGLDYVKLGEQTGQMAAKVLKGEKKAKDLKFEVIKEASFFVNTKVAKDLGIDIPEDLLKSAAEKFDKVEAK